LININGNTEGITVEKKLKQSKKKWWRVIFINGINSVGKIIGKLWTLFIMSITKGITYRKFHQYFPESSKTVHFFNCTVNCCSLRTKSPTDWKVIGVIWWFSEKIQLI
jgi:hypothetical protein